MKTAKTRSLVVASVLATLAVGLVGVPAAHADTSLVVTPATGLSDGQAITITLDGFAPGPLVSAQIAECGNAYANGTPLPSMPVVVTGVLDAVNCEVIAFRSSGTMQTAPVVINDVGVTARQTAIGHGNRSCVKAPPAIAPCFVYVATSINSDPFPQEAITFTLDAPAGGEPAVTATTVTAVGTPVGLGKHAHAMVSVSVPTDSTLTPDGAVQVFEGATLVGSGTLDTTAHASVDIGTLALGAHDLSASFVGNGSFAASASTSPSTMTIIEAKNISIGDASVVEGNSSGPRSVIFPVAIRRPSAWAGPPASTWEPRPRRSSSRPARRR
jgi:Bacterial Ig-like domain (group 3)